MILPFVHPVDTVYLYFGIANVKGISCFENTDMLKQHTIHRIGIINMWEPLLSQTLECLNQERPFSIRAQISSTFYEK